MPKHSRHLNATRHGLRAASLVLPWEDPGELARQAAWRSGFRETLAARCVVGLPGWCEGEER